RKGQSVLINGDVIPYLHSVLVSGMDYSRQADASAVLMNLCLRRAGRRKCESPQTLEMLDGVWEEGDDVVRTCVHGVLFALAENAKWREMAREWGLVEILREWWEIGGDLRDQISLFLSDENTNDNSDDDELSEDGDEDEDDFDTEIESSEDDFATLNEDLYPEPHELTGLSLLKKYTHSTISTRTEITNTTPKRTQLQPLSTIAMLTRPMTPSQHILHSRSNSPNLPATAPTNSLHNVRSHSNTPNPSPGTAPSSIKRISKNVPTTKASLEEFQTAFTTREM
ncbi:hypothetical protein HK096_008970, partial [Nowakowskiella sp. JEL0078]